MNDAELSQAFNERMNGYAYDSPGRKTLRKDGTEVHSGDIVKDFHGVEWVFVEATRARGEGHTGKVLVGTFLDGEPVGQREFYDTVFGLEVVAEPASLPESAVGETNPRTGHKVIDQRGTGSDAVVLAWRDGGGIAEYAVWRLFVTHDGKRGFDAGDYTRDLTEAVRYFTTR